MAIVKIQNDIAKKERQIIIFLITSTKYCNKLFNKFQDVKNYFQTSHTKLIAEWCEEYFKNYKKSPKRTIEEVFHARKENINEILVPVIEDFLSSISSEFEREEKKLNADYIFDITKNYFKTSTIIKLRNSLSDKITSGKIDEAEVLIGDYVFSGNSKEKTKWVNPFHKKETISTFEDKTTDSIMSFPGELGRMIGNLERGNLIAYRGRSGIGKTFWLMQLAMHGAYLGYNVAIASLELTDRQMKERFYSYMTGNLISEERNNGVVRIPVIDCKHNQTGKCDKKIRRNKEKLLISGKKPDFQDIEGYRTCSVCRHYYPKDFQSGTWWKEIKRNVISPADVMERYRDIRETRILKGNLRMITYPSGKVTMNEFISDLNILERDEGFVPDVIVTDYADKFKASERIKDMQMRHQISTVWDEHKSLAIERYCLVATGSQVNQQGEWKEAMAKEELIDIGMTLSQSIQDKSEGIMKISIPKHRSKSFFKENKVSVLYNYAIGRPYLDSFVAKEAEENK